MKHERLGKAMEKEAFKDRSIFQGYTQYFDDWGNEWRRESDSSGIYRFYRLIGDSFMYEYSARIPRNYSIRKGHETFLNQRDN